MTDDEHENLMYNIYVSYTAEDIGEITGEEGSIYWHPSIDGTRIESCVNLDIEYPYFRYIRSISDDEYGKICRIRMDVSEYVYHKGDTILTKSEKTKLIQILNSSHILYNQTYGTCWEYLIENTKMNYSWYKEKENIDLDPLLHHMPDYNLLPTLD